MNDNSKCFELSDLTFTWPNKNEALISIQHLAINYGEHLFIQGASGSGKSTLLNILTGVLTPTSGSLHILDQRFDTLKQAERDQFRADHFGIIFQQFNLIPYLSVVENITLPLSFSKYKQRRTELLDNSAKQHAISLLDALGIDETLINTNVTQLSTGQQQRVAAARALMGTPEIIIADEPTSALDEDTKHNFIELLFREAQKFNSTLVFVSHDQSLASMFDRSLKINDLKRLSQQ